MVSGDGEQASRVVSHAEVVVTGRGKNSNPERTGKKKYKKRKEKITE